MVTSKKSILYDGRQNKYIRHQCIFKQFLFSLENNYIRKPTKLDNFYCFLQNKSSDRSGGANDINFGYN